MRIWHKTEWEGKTELIDVEAGGPERQLPFAFGFLGEGDGGKCLLMKGELSLEA